MKRYLLTIICFLITLLGASSLSAQELVPDQNPNYDLSRKKYMGLSDSVNQWHGTTVQQTYKAYDWFEARQERKREKIQFRRELRSERVKHRYYYQPYYHQSYNSRYRNHWSYWWF
jgi:hypothetical protein